MTSFYDLPKIGLPSNIKIGRSLIKLFKYQKVIRKVGLNVVQNSILATKMPNMQFPEYQNSPIFGNVNTTLNHYYALVNSDFKKSQNL